MSMVMVLPLLVLTPSKSLNLFVVDLFPACAVIAFRPDGGVADMSMLMVALCDQFLSRAKQPPDKSPSSLPDIKSMSPSRLSTDP